MREDMTGSVVPVEHCAAGPDHLFPAAEDFSSPRDQRQAGDHDCKCQACDGHTGDGWPADLELRDVGVDQDRSASMNATSPPMPNMPKEGEKASAAIRA